MRLQSPVNHPKLALREATDSVLEFDQFDDYFPDPLFHMDVDASAFVDRLRAALQQGPLEFGDPYLLPIGEDPDSFRAVVLELAPRVLLHACVERIAREIDDKLLRDKVRGFRYAADRNQGAMADAVDVNFVGGVRAASFFSAPGEGLAQVLDDAASMLVSFDEPPSSTSRAVVFCDVAKYSPSVDRTRLWELLGGLTGPAAHPNLRCVREFVDRVSGSGKGVPSMDDSFAYLWNYYLLPLDRYLAESKDLFLRYRDEYYLCGDSEEATLEALSRLKKQAKERLGLELNESKTNILRGSSITNPDPSWSRGRYVMHLSEERKRIIADGDGTDRDVWYYHADVDVLEVTKYLLALIETPGADHLHEAFGSLGVLNRIRAPYALDDLAADDSQVLGAYAGYRAQLLAKASVRQALRAHLEAAVQAGHAWKADWVVAMLGDHGRLSGEEAGLLRRIVENTTMNTLVRLRALVTICRGAPQDGLGLVALFQTPGPLEQRYVLLARFFSELRFKSGALTSNPPAGRTADFLRGRLGR
jgi:hypothetical protein